jgi:hypothetical protein
MRKNYQKRKKNSSIGSGGVYMYTKDEIEGFQTESGTPVFSDYVYLKDETSKMSSLRRVREAAMP